MLRMVQGYFMLSTCGALLSTFIPLKIFAKFKFYLSKLNHLQWAINSVLKLSFWGLKYLQIQMVQANAQVLQIKVSEFDFFELSIQ